MRVLLIVESPRKKGLYLTRSQPLGILYIASFLESKGIGVDVKDYTVEERNPLDYARYSHIGYSLNSANIENTLSSIALVKKQQPDIPIIIGGSHAVIVTEKLITNPNVNCVIVNEAEDILYNYITARDKTTIKGIWLRDKGVPFFTGHREPISNLDGLPFPAIDKVPYKKYRVVLRRKKAVCTILTSRGCPYNCIFCHHSLGFKYRARSPENVIQEIIWLKEHLGIKELWVVDDAFAFNEKRAERICDLIIEKGIKISISLANGVRADRLNETLLRKLKKAGCWFLTISPETGDEESLRKIGKGFSLKDVERVVGTCKELGIKTMANFVIGFPWEREKDIETTISFAKRLDPDLIQIQRLVPFPGTPVWEMVEKGAFSLVDENTSFNDKRFLHPYLSEEEIQEFIRRGNRMFYTPRKLLNLAKFLHPADMISLARYALGSRSIC